MNVTEFQKSKMNDVTSLWHNMVRRLFQALSVVSFLALGILGGLLACFVSLFNKERDSLTKNSGVALVFGTLDIPFLFCVALRLSKIESVATMKRDGWLGIICGCLFGTAFAFLATIDIPSLPFEFLLFLYIVILKSVLAGSLLLFVVGFCFYRLVQRVCLVSQGNSGFVPLPSQVNVSV